MEQAEQDRALPRLVRPPELARHALARPRRCAAILVGFLARASPNRVGPALAAAQSSRVLVGSALRPRQRPPTPKFSSGSSMKRAGPVAEREFASARRLDFKRSGLDQAGEKKPPEIC